MPGRLNVWFRWSAVAVVLALAVDGCGSGTSKVHGKVTYQGKTVVWGSVTIVDKTGQFHVAEIDLNGNYSIEKIPTGSVKISVVSPNPEPPKGRDDPIKRGPAGGKGVTIDDPREKFMAGKEKQVEPRPKPPAGAWFAIPDKFGDPEQSGLTGDVKPGTTELNIDIK
jgi:hypothetical protein